VLLRAEPVANGAEGGNPSSPTTPRRPALVPNSPKRMTRQPHFIAIFPRDGRQTPSEAYRMRVIASVLRAARRQCVDDGEVTPFRQSSSQARRLFANGA
jgi:hypothetical protein